METEAKSSIIEYTVSEPEVGLRADIFLSQKEERFSRSEAQRLIASELILLNGKSFRASTRLKLGDGLQVLSLSCHEPSELTPCPMSLDILFEDECLIVVNKPAGLQMHPGAGNHGPTLVEGVLAHIGAKLARPLVESEAQRPGVVHRLDKGTSGVVVLAKDRLTHEALAQQFKAKTNLREYLAVVAGKQLSERCRIESYLHRDPVHRTKYCSMSIEGFEREFPSDGTKQVPRGYRKAASVFFPMYNYSYNLSLIKCRLETGRTHQIRVHAAALGFPVVGDPLYQDQASFALLCKKVPENLRELLVGLKHQLLHAHTLGFIHPKLKEKLAFSADPPAIMQQVLNTLRLSADKP